MSCAWRDRKKAGSVGSGGIRHGKEGHRERTALEHMSCFVLFFEHRARWRSRRWSPRRAVKLGARRRRLVYQPGFLRGVFAVARTRVFFFVAKFFVKSSLQEHQPLSGQDLTTSWKPQTRLSAVAQDLKTINSGHLYGGTVCSQGDRLYGVGLSSLAGQSSIYIIMKFIPDGL